MASRSRKSEAELQENSPQDIVKWIKLYLKDNAPVEDMLGNRDYKISVCVLTASGKASVPGMEAIADITTVKSMIMERYPSGGSYELFVRFKKDDGAWSFTQFQMQIAPSARYSPSEPRSSPQTGSNGLPGPQGDPVELMKYRLELEFKGREAEKDRAHAREMKLIELSGVRGDHQPAATDPFESITKALELFGRLKKMGLAPGAAAQAAATAAGVDDIGGEEEGFFGGALGNVLHGLAQGLGEGGGEMLKEFIGSLIGGGGQKALPAGSAAPPPGPRRPVTLPPGVEERRAAAAAAGARAGSVNGPVQDANVIKSNPAASSAPASTSGAKEDPDRKSAGRVPPVRKKK